MPELTGKTLGTYQILEQLGEGGMATVYKAYDLKLERHVAIKVIRTDKKTSENFLKRFEREAKTLAKLAHPNIVGILDYGEQEGVPYLVMEYVPGGTLADRLGRVFSVEETAGLLLPVARALENAHQQGILHRDVKPSNIMITATGEPMLSDFGLAKILEEKEGQKLTTTGVGIGTPAYMAPEQVKGEHCDGRTDEYSLGIVFYEMVTGRTPYQATTPMAVAVKHISDPLPDPHKFKADLSDEAVAFLKKVLTKEPENRFPDMAAVARALTWLAKGGGGVEAASLFQAGQLARVNQQPAPYIPVQPQRYQPAPLTRKVSKKKSRRWLAWAIPTALVAIAAVVISLVAVTGGFKTGGDRKICMITDTGGLNDHSYNETAWRGITEAMEEYGLEGLYLESTQDYQFISNVNSFLNQDCDLIFGNGFLLGEPVFEAATNHPDQQFALVDAYNDQSLPNVLGSKFVKSESTFMAGYLAAAMTGTGKVGIYSGLQIPATVEYMNGYYLGVQKFNEDNDAHVEVIGWDPVSQSGLFTDDFMGEDAGREAAGFLLDSGADIIMSVAGKASLGVLEALRERGHGSMIGVDVDWAGYYPEYADIILASVVQGYDLFVSEAIASVVDDTFVGGLYTGDLENGGVSLVINENWSGEIPSDLWNELDDIESEIIERQIKTTLSEGEEVPGGRGAGTAADPINIVFASNANSSMITAAGMALADALHESTGLYFIPVVASSYANAVELMCDTSMESIGFLPSILYVFASQQCDVEVALKATNNGREEFYSQIIVRRDRTDIVTLADLEGLTWGYANPVSISSHIGAAGILRKAGVTPGDEVVLGGQQNPILAVYNGEIDFGSTYYAPPEKPDGEPAWAYGDDPDISPDLIGSCAPQEVDGIQGLYCGDWQVMDARSTVIDMAPDIMQQVGVLNISEPIPFESLVFSPEFPQDLREDIVASMQTYPQTEVWSNSLGMQELYAYDGIVPASDGDYDFLRTALEATGMTVESFDGQ